MTTMTTTDVTTITPISHREAMQLQSTELERAITQLRSLDPDDWSTRTVCPDWDVRQMWLHVTARDKGGKALYESGSVDAEGNIDPEAVIYKTVLGEGGKERKPTFFLPAAVQVLSDKRISPRGYSVEPYAFPLPESAQGEIEIEATLRYRSAPQFLINELLGEKAPTLPIVDMATTRRKIPLL